MMFQDVKKITQKFFFYSFIYTIIIMWMVGERYKNPIFI